MRKKWLKVIHREDTSTKLLWEPNADFIYICSKHFVGIDYEPDTSGGYKRLKQEAVPSVFLAHPPYLQPVSNYAGIFRLVLDM
jgi:hypothetical protein